MALVTGKPVFLEDQIPAGTLVVKLLRSPHANALVEEIHKTQVLLDLVRSHGCASVKRG